MLTTEIKILVLKLMSDLLRAHAAEGRNIEETITYLERTVRNLEKRGLNE